MPGDLIPTVSPGWAGPNLADMGVRIAGLIVLGRIGTVATVRVLFLLIVVVVGGGAVVLVGVGG